MTTTSAVLIYYFATAERRSVAPLTLWLRQCIRARLTLTTLTDDEYFQGVEEAAALGLSSGAIYDAIIGQCAVKAGAKSIYTRNVNHFVRLGPAVASRVKTP